MSEDLQLCRDCRFLKRNWLGGMPDYAKCLHHQVSPAVVDKVTGSTKPDLKSCSGARIHGPCGPKGNLWSRRGAA